MKKLAFITSEEDPNLINDDQLAIGPLEKLGYLVAPLVWDHNSQIDGFDALIFLFRILFPKSKLLVKLHWYFSMVNLVMRFAKRQLIMNFAFIPNMEENVSP